MQFIPGAWPPRAARTVTAGETAGSALRETLLGGPGGAAGEPSGPIPGTFAPMGFHYAGGHHGEAQGGAVGAPQTVTVS